MSRAWSDDEQETLFNNDALSIETDYGTLNSSKSPSAEEEERQLSACTTVCGDEGHENKVPAESQFLGGLSKKRFWLLFVCIIWNEFVSHFDSTLMVSLHPVITSYFNSSNSASWLSTAFLITSTAFMPLFAPLSDTIGRRFVWLFASLTLAFAIVWCAVAADIGSFIAARALCGLGAGGTMSMGAIIINDLVPIETRATYQSMMILAFGIGQTSGAALGGLLCDTIGWRWSFGIQVPGVLLCSLASYLATPSDLGPRRAKHAKSAFRSLMKTLDLAGLIFLALSVTCLILFLNLGGNVFPWSHPCIIASLVTALVSMCCFVRVESKASNPIMPARLLITRPRGYLNFLNFCGSLIVSAIIFNIPLYFEVVRGDSPTVAGLRLIVPFLALPVAGFVSCMVINSRVWIRPAIICGTIMMLTGAICLACMGRKLSSWVTLVFLVPSSAGMGIAFPAINLCLLRTSPPGEHAMVTSTMFLIRRLGSVIGVALSTLVMQGTLLSYLQKLITGSHKAEIILQIRESVRSIPDLSPSHQEEAITAYSAALRVAFASMIIVGVLLVAVALPVRLPDEDVTEERAAQA